MTDRIIDISTRGMRLRINNSLLTIDHPDFRQPEEIPVSDVAAVVFSTPSASMTQPVVAELSKAGAIVVFCDVKHQPVAMTLPLNGNVVQAERFRLQASASLPVKKRAWREIVICKIKRQADVLARVCGDEAGLTRMAAKVKSNDAENMEGQAAGIYWRSLNLSTKRRRGYDNINSVLDFGYTVLHALVARSLCAAGLHPCLGLHHQNRYNPFCLASDIMEPFRPIIDETVVSICNSNKDETTLSKTVKAELLTPLLNSRVLSVDNEWRSLINAVNRLCSSLVHVFKKDTKSLQLPLRLDCGLTDHD